MGMEMVWDWKSIGSLLATLVVIRSAVRDFLPPEIRRFLRSLLGRLVTSLQLTATIVIEEQDASSSPNDLYDAAQTYLGSRCLASAPVVTLSKARNSTRLSASLPPFHTILDSFHGIPLRWTSRAVDTSSSSFSSPHSSSSDHRSLELSFHNRHRDTVYSQYIPHVIDEASRIHLMGRDRRLYTNRPGSHGDDHHRLWSSVPFAHPATFDTLAIDPALRDDLRSDLFRFVDRHDHYARVGRAWKRGYLLHGPPGTGKTSLVAAIANLLKFDVYDLELTAVSSNTQLRRLLASTTPKSVIVVEDVDCSLDLSDRDKKKDAPQPYPNPTPQPASAAALRSAIGYGGVGTAVSLSGVLNFVDGLWSSCVGERLMIFTTNHPERLDPALLRPGRIDRSIHLSYCGPAAFRVLARNYLEIEEEELEELMPEVEALLLEVRITPAEVAEVFMGCDGEGADAAMQKVVEEMRRRKSLAPPSNSVVRGEDQKGQ